VLGFGESCERVSESGVELGFGIAGGGCGDGDQA
jgi:hypothetical protein